MLDMLAGEDPEVYVRRAFTEVLSPLSQASLDAVNVHFHPDFKQFADGAELGLEAFTKLLRVQKSRLATAPKFVWKNLVASQPRGGVIHVTSVHTATARLKTGAALRQQVVALIQIDVATGKIIQCDELTRMEQPSPMVYSSPGVRAGAFEGAGSSQELSKPEAKRCFDEGSRPCAVVPPPPKQARRSPDAYDKSETVRLQGIPLKRTLPSDHLEPPTITRASSLGSLAKAFAASLASLGPAATVSKTAAAATDTKGKHVSLEGDVWQTITDMPAMDADTGRSFSYASTHLVDESDCDDSLYSCLSADPSRNASIEM